MNAQIRQYNTRSSTHGSCALLFLCKKVRQRTFLATISHACRSKWFRRPRFRRLVLFLNVIHFTMLKQFSQNFKLQLTHSLTKNAGKRRWACLGSCNCLFTRKAPHRYIVQLLSHKITTKSAILMKKSNDIRWKWTIIENNRLTDKLLPIIDKPIT